MRLNHLTAAVLALTSAGLAQADGDLDSSFGLFGSGKNIVFFDEGTPPYDHLVDTLIDNEGRIYLIGQVEDAQGRRQIGVSRLLPNGLVDTSFGIDGTRTTSFSIDRYATAAALRNDGDLLVSNRYSDNGDSMFSVCVLDKNTGSTKTFSGTSSACVDADPDVIPGGFDEPKDILVQPWNDKFVVVGTSVAGDNLYAGSIARFNGDGTLDTTFSGDGVAYLAESAYIKANAVTLSHDNLLLVCGEYRQPGGNESDFYVAKLGTSNGSLVGDFAGDGTLAIPFDLGAVVAERNDVCNDLAVAPDDSIYLAGYAQDGANTYDGAVVRLTATGSLFGSFSGDGKRNIAAGQSFVVTDIENQDDGRAVTLGTRTPQGGGASDLHVVRLSTTGTLQADFGEGGHRSIDFTMAGEYEFAGGMVLQNDRAVVAGSGWTDAQGNEDFVVARLTGDAIFVSSFID